MYFYHIYSGNVCACNNSKKRELAGNEKSSASSLQQLQRLLSSEITSCYNDIGFAVHVGIYNPSSEARSQQGWGEREWKPQFWRTFQHWFWSIAKVLHLQKSSAITFLLLWPITKIIVSSTLSSRNEKRAKAKWCHHKSRHGDSTKGEEKGQDSDFIKGYVLCH